MKKIVFLTLILLGSSLAVFAQTLKVTDFKRTNDLSAVRFPVNDINGVPCGLIKIWLPLPDAKFIGNVMKSVYKNGEWWVYMTNGTKRLKIKTAKYSLDYSFVEHQRQIQIQSNVTYAMMLEIPELLTTGFLSLSGDKKLLSSSLITIDGKEKKYEQGKPYELEIGKHKIRVLYDCYSPFEQDVVVEGGKMNTLDVVLTPICATFTLKSKEKARIYVDGIQKGKGSAAVKLDFGRSYKFESRRFGRIKGINYKTIEIETDRNIVMPKTKSILSRLPLNFTTGNIAYGFEPQMSYGISFGFLDWDKPGWYFSVLSNYKFYSKTGDCDAEGYLEDGTYPEYMNEPKKSRFSIIGGLILPLNEDMFTLRIGGGYGERNLYWVTQNGTYYRNLGYSVRGFDGSLGLQFCPGKDYSHTRMVISIDYVVTNFKVKQFSEIKLGVGFTFNN